MKPNIIAEECRAISNRLSEVASEMDKPAETTDSKKFMDAVNELHYLAEKLSALDKYMGWR